MAALRTNNRSETLSGQPIRHPKNRKQLNFANEPRKSLKTNRITPKREPAKLPKYDKINIKHPQNQTISRYIQTPSRLSIAAAIFTGRPTQVPL